MTLPVGFLIPQSTAAPNIPGLATPFQPVIFPVAKKIRVNHLAHNDIRADDYDWMRHKSDPDFLSFLENWNTFSDGYLERLKPFSAILYQEMAKRIESDYESIPYCVGDYYYFKRFISGKDFPIYCRKPIEGGQVDILLDVNTLNQKYTYFDVKEFIPSPDGAYAIMTIDTDGSHFGFGHLFDCSKKAFVNEELIPQTNGNFVWNQDGSGFWYVKLNEVKRFAHVYFHRIGTPVEADRSVHEEPNGFFDLYLTKDKLNEWLFIASVSKTSSLYHRLPLKQTIQSPEIILPRQDGLLYTVVQGGDRSYVLANMPDKNNSLFVFANQELKPLVISGKHTHIDKIEVFENYVVMKKRSEGILQFDVFDVRTNEIHKIPLPTEVCDMDFYYNTRFHENKVMITLSSPIIPLSTYEWDMSCRQLTLRHQENANGFQTQCYASERIVAYNGDTAIPISLFYKKGLPQDGSSPLRLYCYGAYGATTDPAFSPVTATFLERDCYYAVAHVRGSGDLGQAWYEEGRLDKKINTFNDFIACAETLIKLGYTSSHKLAIEGGSAGGLVIAEAMNRRPDLFKICLLDVPFVDVVTTMSDPNIPLTEQEWKEWGNPKIKEQYEWLKFYSPYDNIRAREYPACLVTGGFNDAQVPIREPAKFVAKLSEFKLGQNPLLFKTNMNGGHNGKAGRYESYEECAPSYAFMLNQIGINK